jgi:CO dehydrogenase maturation factor
MRAIDKLLLISDYSIIGVRSAKRILELVKELGIKVGAASLVINKVGGFLEPLQDEIRATGVRFAGAIPYDASVEDWSISNEPIFAFESIAIKDKIREVFSNLMERK